MKFKDYMNEAIKLKAGDNVQYTDEFLKSFGGVSKYKGKIKSIVKRRGLVLATVVWDRPPMYSHLKPEEINVTNLEKVK